MQINLKECSKNKVIEFLNKESVIKNDEFDILHGEDLKIIDDVAVNGDIFVLDNLLKVKFNLSTKFEFVCSRCLGNFTYDLNLNCSDEILLDDLDEDIILDSDGNLDFTDYIKNYIIVNIPQKKLCKVDCLGLCQYCGVNLNNGTCSCQGNEFENAFSRLREVFVDSKEV
ncbi:YceD family protein [Candidatus Arthromitus sp. SFB-turkey]|uniref:YceD family protein n=1 Tax=Candidatus Arthromitus sp. SFB-turkey TaxID=1840217 RepID=UPI0007F4FDEE|nr:DUF177 domain-containing protein [Candidatus Arthromitus sp. SFB-turkey]OAT87896.1 hypothetical protein A6P36_03485 [Candidatus Arthromitus sp. SFB-turkey]